MSSSAPPGDRPEILVTVRHHPRPEHRQNLLDAMRRINAASSQVPGLLLDAAFEEDHGSVVAVSVWSSIQAVQPGMQQLLGFAGAIDLEAWESRPPEMTMLRSAL